MLLELSACQNTEAIKSDLTRIIVSNTIYSFKNRLPAQIYYTLALLPDKPAGKS